MIDHELVAQKIKELNDLLGPQSSARRVDLAELSSHWGSDSEEDARLFRLQQALNEIERGIWPRYRVDKPAKKELTTVGLSEEDFYVAAEMVQNGTYWKNFLMRICKEDYPENTLASHAAVDFASRLVKYYGNTEDALESYEIDKRVKEDIVTAWRSNAAVIASEGVKRSLNKIEDLIDQDLHSDKDVDAVSIMWDLGYFQKVSWEGGSRDRKTLTKVLLVLNRIKERLDERWAQDA